MTISDILVQAVGYAGMAMYIVSYQIKSNRIFFFIQTAASLMFVIQFVLLGAISGCINLSICILRNILMLKYNDWAWVRWRGWVVIFVGALAVVTALTWAGPISILSFTGAASGTIGVMSNNAQKIRAAYLGCCCPSWLIYDAIIGSWGGVCNEIITIVSILISIKRYGWREMGDPNSDFQTK
ncbi:MAG: YgjV family protein [Eubacterium sp.]|nr:YgjV family protein [Candidatus Colimonas fimequi]